MLSIFKPAPHQSRVAADRTDPLYRRLRWQIFIGIFSVTPPTIWYEKLRAGHALSGGARLFTRRSRLCPLRHLHCLWLFEIYYGFGLRPLKSTRFPARRPDNGGAGDAGDGLCSLATSSIMIMFTLLFVCGWFQGMGWPPCGRTMVHWWSQKERGGIVSVWNCAHNVGGGIPTAVSAWYGRFNDWKAALYMPAFAAIVVALIALR